MIKTIDPDLNTLNPKNNKKELQNVDSENQLLIQNFNQLDDSVKNLEELSDDGANGLQMR